MMKAEYSVTTIFMFMNVFFFLDKYGWVDKIRLRMAKQRSGVNHFPSGGASGKLQSAS
jgi:hypothetical protein